MSSPQSEPSGRVALREPRPGGHPGEPDRGGFPVVGSGEDVARAVPAGTGGHSVHIHLNERRRPRRSLPGASFWRGLGLHLLIPLFLAAGMALAYLGAFGQPTPHHLPVAVVGSSAESEVFAQSLNDSAPEALDVRTVPDAAAARALIESRDVVASYEATATDATISVSSAASDTTASVVEKVFLPIAYRQHLPVQVDDVVPTGEGDPTGQGLFFLMVALSVGGYASAAAISAVVAASRTGLATRLGIAVGTAALVAAIGTVVVGPVYGIVDHALWPLWLLSWLYVSGIVVVGVGLHPLLRHWTTPVLTMLFVMLNFTSSGGVFAAQLVPSFFSALSAFWNGSAWLHATQTVVYFPAQGIGRDGLVLALWLAAGVGLAVLTHAWSRRRTRLADERAEVTEEDEVVAA
ncbi:hypothetical protein EDF38_0680 [Frigoribacterium sp. PhB160]|uniref:hypothetical protein n=1 Tax=Frigoribacterium sp. PhB160 TaxID=2485192 RepID=UPI000F4AA16F|nr:hypothetical protein [Frigoribacterium sp. PhB160]ROS61590.1 hypothetical protein EDF38_0680 [Frigoribacterium sp. PhB160]